MNNAAGLTAKRIALGLLRGMVLVLVALSVLLTVVSYFIGGIVFNRAPYHAMVKQPPFTQQMVSYAREELEAECLFYDLPFDIIDEVVTEQTVAAFSEKLVDAVYDAAFGDGALKAPTMDAAPFRAAIAARLEDVDDQVIDDLAAEFAAITTAVLQSGLSQEILAPVHGVLSHPLIALVSQGFTVLLILTLVLIGVSVALGIGRMPKQLFATAAAVLCAAILLFVPLWLLHSYDLPSKLLLGDSPLKLYVVGLLNGFISRFFTTALWVLIGAAVATVAATVWRVWPMGVEEAPPATAEQPISENIEE